MRLYLIYRKILLAIVIMVALIGTMPGWDFHGFAHAQDTPLHRIEGRYIHIGTLHHPVAGTIVAGHGECIADGLGNATCDPFSFALAGGGGTGSIDIVFTLATDAAGNTNGTGTFEETLNLPDGTSPVTNSWFVITETREDGLALKIYAWQQEGAGGGALGLLSSIFEWAPDPAQ